MRRLAIALAALLAACQADATGVIDGSTPDSYRDSLAAVRADLSPAQRLKFEAALKLVQASAFANADSREAMQARVRQKLDGRTAAEVIADYERRKTDVANDAVDQIFDLKRQLGGRQQP